ncbi:serine protease [Terriglobus sp. 2YAB30_2]|uniref:S1 family peptidase n=1 Tax=Terriglobus sp. 2YAB30_2 TaxID=3233023 RepID=UPI003F97A6A4
MYGIRKFGLFIVLCLGFTLCLNSDAQDNQQATPILTSVDTKLLLDAAGPTQRASLQNVYLIGCQKGKMISFGSGFLLNNGVLVTNAHVVNDCTGQQLAGISTSNKEITFSNTILDNVRDLAILIPSKAISGGYALGADVTPEAGTRVDFWGYPFGYNGTFPLLGVGYVAGYRTSRDNGGSVKHLVVNGAINHGNSGGPLLVSQQNEVIGVIVLTFHFYPPEVRQIIDAMAANSGSGVVYNYTRPDGTKGGLMEAQLTAAVLDEFYNKTQIDIGEAITASELRQFMQEHVADLPAGMPKAAPIVKKH